MLACCSPHVGALAYRRAKSRDSLCPLQLGKPFGKPFGKPARYPCRVLCRYPRTFEPFTVRRWTSAMSASSKRFPPSYHLEQAPVVHSVLAVQVAKAKNHCLEGAAHARSREVTGIPRAKVQLPATTLLLTPTILLFFFYPESANVPQLGPRVPSCWWYKSSVRVSTAQISLLHLSPTTRP